MVMWARTTAISFLLLAPLVAQHEHAAEPAKPAIILPGLGDTHHAIGTRNPEAQRFFDQGLALIYGFNHEEAVNSFRRAAELDPQAAMPWWGVALALGPNINLDVDPEREKAAYDAVQKALSLGNSAPAEERDYIQALSKRYANNPKADLKKLAAEYSKAMGALSAKYPDDLDAATLYAESMMDLRPWKLWTIDGKPAPGTLEIVAVLESVLRRDPKHVGANHYYIHAVEASPNPERALPSADRLAGLMPGAGHVVHMPAHIYIQLGDYETVAKTNETAAAVDRDYMQRTGNTTGVYPLMYYNHNIHFVMTARLLQGQFTPAKRAADELAGNVLPALGEMPMLQSFAPMPWTVLLRFERWDEMLQTPAPDPKFKLLTAMWRFSRAVALVGKKQVAEAKREQEQFASAVAAVPADTPWDIATAAAVLRIGTEELAARIAEAGGDRAGAIERWRKATAAQDQAGYSEPSLWYYSTRESLGGALLRAGRAAEAETVFREDLVKHPRSPRSLFGLLESLRAQKKPTESVERQFKESWAHADQALRVEQL